MLLNDIHPKYIVLNQTYDEFAKDTETINYETEDFVSQVTDITSVLYTNSLETIWGFLGFTWDVYNDYGHFNNISMDFSIIPKIPDAYRLKRFTRQLFANVTKRKIEVLDSNFENIEEVFDISNCTNKEFIFHFASISENVVLNLLNSAISEANTDTNAVTLYCKDNHIVFYKQIGSFLDAGGLGKNNTNRYYILNKENINKKHYYSVSNTNANGALKNVIYYDENEVFDTKDYFNFEQNTIELDVFVLMAKTNNIILHPFYRNAITSNNLPPLTIFPNISFQHEYDANVYKRLHNFIDVALDFENNMENAWINLPTDCYYKTVNYKNLDKINAPIKYKNLSKLLITRELNNLDWFKNECNFDVLYKAQSERKIINGYFGSPTIITINDKLSFSVSTFELRIEAVAIDKYVKEINTYNTDVAVYYFAYTDKYVTEAYQPAIISFINCKNSTILFNTARNAALKYNEEEQYYSLDIVDSSLKRIIPIISRQIECHNFIDNTSSGAGNICLWASDKNNLIINNIYIRLLTRAVYYQYNLENLVEYNAPIKLVIDNSQYVIGVFVFNFFFLKSNNDGYYNVNDLQELFNAIFDTYGYINVIEVDNSIGHVFTTDDYMLLGCAGNLNGANVTSSYKNNRLKYKGNNYYICPTNVNINPTLRVFFDVEHWDAIFNVSIEFCTVQTDIHIFINAFMNEPCTGKDISIVHENFIQLTEEEKTKLANLNYTLIDKII